MRTKWFSFKFGKIISLFIIVIAGAFLRFDRLGELMPFIGDQGWFYLSARDMILTGNIPLVGITSSHTWLHQGPLWTYMLASTLWISNFNPVSGAILAATIGVASIFLIYKLGEEFFSRNFGLIAALIYATSPLVVVHERLAYHTSPISFLVLVLIYSLLKVVKGKEIFAPLIALSLSLLYNFELATVVFIPFIFSFLVYGVYKKAKWIKYLKSQKIILFSSLALVIPMIPVLIYDFGHGLPQTLKFGAWFIYKGLQLIGIIEKPAVEPFSTVVGFFVNKVSLLIFSPSVLLSIIILTFALIFSTIYILKKKDPFSQVVLIFILTTVGIIGFFGAGARSEAYLPMLFPGIILLTTFSTYSLFENKLFGAIIVILISISNAIFIVQNNYLMDISPGYGPSFEKRIEVVDKILKQANTSKYNLEGKGIGSQFESFTMNYEYLLWWKGSPSSHELQNLGFVIEENQGRIDVKIR